MTREIKRKKIQYKSLTKVKTCEKRVWEDIRSIELGYASNPNAHEYSKILGLNILGPRIPSDPSIHSGNLGLLYPYTLTAQKSPLRVVYTSINFNVDYKGWFHLH